MSKGSRPRSGYNPVYRDNFDDVFGKPAVPTTSDPYTYPSGFKSGERVRILPGERKHNNHIVTTNALATVMECGVYCPIDAVDVRTDDGGRGYIDADSLERV